MNAPTALLLFLFFAANAVAANEPIAPQTLPIIYDQPGDLYILRIDNRRYQLPYTTKTPIAELLSAANYPRTKLLFEEFKRTLEDKAKAEAIIRRAQSNLDRESERVRRQNQTIESLRSQLALTRSQPVIDVRQALFLQEQIRLATATLASLEDREAKARKTLLSTQDANESIFSRADKARDTYASALTDYEKPLSKIRSLAMSLGKAL